MQAPDWLTNRDASIVRGPIAQERYVWIGKRPQYKLTPIPADGKFTCAVLQTNNGRRLDNGALFATSDEAIRAGLECLRNELGW
jgi:hypothetical protein